MGTILALRITIDAGLCTIDPILLCPVGEPSGVSRRVKFENCFLSTFTRRLTPLGSPTGRFRTP
jgi:hypothetical protein